jgi:hypothetical protein
MKFIRKSSAEEYAHSFWVRENRKNKAIMIPSSPLEQLKKPREEGGHPYKLPPPEFLRWGVWLLTTPAEMENLMVIQDTYMEDREFLVTPPTLGNVVRRAIETDFFETPKTGTQYRLFHEWRNSKLADRIKGDDRLCLQAITEVERARSPTSLFYIKDGWGRSLPYLTLVTLGHEFFPVEVYIAE